MRLKMTTSAPRGFKRGILAAMLFAFACLTPPAAGRDDPSPIISPIAPTSLERAQPWRLSFEKPPAGWETTRFKDAAWKKGKGGFGTREAARTVRAIWKKTEDIWIRRPFRMEGLPFGDIKLHVHHLGDTEVYLNGILAARLRGSTNDYVTVPVEIEALAALKAGNNLLAAHSRQPGEKRYLDVGLVAVCDAKDMKSAVFYDWLLQDARGNPRIFTSARDAAPERAAVEAALKELGDAGKAFGAELARLVAARVPGKDPRWRRLYTRVCETRRAARLKPLLARWRKIVFAKHWNVGGSHYAYTECQSDAQAERHWVPEAALCLLHLDGLYGRIETLVDDPKGIIRNPDVSYDGKKILFSWKKDDRKDDYHLYEMDAATRKVRQLTDGLGFADYEGCYLPDGDIIFNSTRCVQTVDCWWTEVSNLYTCDGDGRFLRRLSFDQVHTNFPTVTHDGRVLYTRWEYSDRGQIYPQALFQMYLDGTAQMECYGNSSWFPTTIIHARAVPDTAKIIAVATGHHSDQSGKLIMIDLRKGRQENQGVQLIAPVRETPAARIDSYGQNGDQFQYPYPLDETRFLVTYAPLNPGRAGKRGFGLYLMDLEGRRELLAWDPTLSCNQPVPLAPRPPGQVRPSIVDYRKTTGTFYVQDVYRGAGMKGIPRGTVKNLRVVTVEYRAAGIGSNRNHGPAGGALISTPIAIDNGAWDVKKVIGSVPVEADGSAYFTVPARTPVYFQLLDAKGHVVQTMRSWSTLQPGERLSCVGCHEGKNESAPLAGAAVTAALKKPPQSPRPFYGPTRGFSYPKEIQPIWNRHCISCHTGEKDKPSSLLAREKLDDRAKRRWAESYLNLTQRGKSNPTVNWISIQSAPPLLPPYHAGAAKSGLMPLLEKGHYEVKLSREEMEKIACWIDLLIPYCGDYVEANAWSKGEMEKYNRYLKKRLEMERVEQENIRKLISERSRTAGR